jgi:hypothetical protein
MSQDHASNDLTPVDMQSDRHSTASSQTTTNADVQPDAADIPHQGTPLSGILLLIAVAAVAAAIVGSGIGSVTFDDRYRPPNRWARVRTTETPPGGLRWVDRDRVIFYVIFFATLTAIVGTVVGLWYPPRIRRGVAGGLVGLVMGGATGLLIFCPPHFGVTLSGAAVILAAAFAQQLASRHVV